MVGANSFSNSTTNVFPIFSGDGHNPKLSWKKVFGFEFRQGGEHIAVGHVRSRTEEDEMVMSRHIPPVVFMDTDPCLKRTPSHKTGRLRVHVRSTMPLERSRVELEYLPVLAL
jgi:hypothetical protein